MLAAKIAGLHTRTPPECHGEGRGLANPIDACEKEDLGLVLTIYSRRQLLANAVMAASRVAA
jgi:hypothetical protein